jgi:hypothetical protein
MEIRPIEESDLDEWLCIRLALWPERRSQELRAEMDEIL